ncbi:MAG TPA: hypothetical protein VHW43_03795, partial [Puia sp.]|nr:hypothetical protein [Puia sp.]
MSISRLQEIVVSNTERSKEIKQLERQGLLRRIAPRIYTSNLQELPERILRRNWYQLLSEQFPDALLSHRSALESKPTETGHLYLTRSYRGILEMPGLTLHFIQGPPPLDDDPLFYGNLHISGTARAWLENLERTRGMDGESKTMSREQLEEKIESFLRVKGEAALNIVRDRANAIAARLGLMEESQALNQLITDLLGTGLAK